eukprot:1157442-Pelagomonas_calceolata.AAC.3
MDPSTEAYAMQSLVRCAPRSTSSCPRCSRTAGCSASASSAAAFTTSWPSMAAAAAAGTSLTSTMRAGASVHRWAASHAHTHQQASAFTWFLVAWSEGSAGISAFAAHTALLCLCFDRATQQSRSLAQPKLCQGSYNWCEVLTRMGAFCLLKQHAVPETAVP